MDAHVPQRPRVVRLKLFLPPRAGEGARRADGGHRSVIRMLAAGGPDPAGGGIAMPGEERPHPPVGTFPRFAGEGSGCGLGSRLQTSDSTRPQ